eukprot:7391093-Prymnesium_polylepis.2
MRRGPERTASLAAPCARRSRRSAARTRKGATLQAECSTNNDSSVATIREKPSIGSTGASRVTRASYTPPTCMRRHAPATDVGDATMAPGTASACRCPAHRQRSTAPAKPQAPRNNREKP